MILRLDLGTAPPQMTLLESEDLKTFKAEVTVGSHLFVHPDELERLGPGEPIGSRASTPWSPSLPSMAGPTIAAASAPTSS